jgi:hypothetical protein
MRAAAMRNFALLAAVLTLALAGASHALEVAGAKFPERIEMTPGGQPLVLNGGGIRKAYFLSIYAAGLYLPAPSTDAAKAIDMLGAKRVAMQMLRDVDTDTFVDALSNGLRANHSEAQMAAFAPKIERLTAIMSKLGTAKEGTRVTLDLVPGQGTQVTIDGAPQGAPIPGEDFSRALPRTWIGEHPVTPPHTRARLRGAAAP